ncbi:MAG: aldo/keto reductase [Candidatus Nanohaloarchaea archaeon]
MDYIEIQGEEIPAPGLGTWQMTEGCADTVKRALDMGYRHVDTAQAYRNERKVGEGIQESEVDRDEFWLTTKLWRKNLNRRRLKDSVEQSLEKLKTDYVDLLLIHWPFRDMDLEVVLEEMNEVVAEGKARNIVVSNFKIRQMEQAKQLSERKLLTNQVEYHPFLDQQKVLQKCRQMDMMLTAYSPLARGDVIGNETLSEIGESYGKTAAQVALKWLIQQENVSAIPKASSEKHLRQNLDIFDFQLSESEMETIDRLKGDQRKLDPAFAPDWD